MFQANHTLPHMRHTAIPKLPLNQTIRNLTENISFFEKLLPNHDSRNMKDWQLQVWAQDRHTLPGHWKIPETPSIFQVRDNKKKGGKQENKHQPKGYNHQIC